jgi:hypothetical protein
LATLAPDFEYEKALYPLPVEVALTHRLSLISLEEAASDSHQIRERDVGVQADQQGNMLEYPLIAITFFWF